MLPTSLCECGHTLVAHQQMLTPGFTACEYALAFNGHGCGCAEYDPAEPLTFVQTVLMAKNQLEMARIYAELVTPLKGLGLASASTHPVMEEVKPLNRAIIERWSLSGLARIKRVAWSL
jgi:hypothetical protein